MAKAEQIEFNNNSHDWFVDVLKTRFAEVLEYRDSALDADETKGVHNMRVALRRLRSVIRDFTEVADEFPLKDLRDSLKKLADSLGGVRDADVLIEVLEKLQEDQSAAAVMSGLTSITEHYKQKRSDAYAEMQSYLDQALFAKLEDDFQSALKDSRRRSDLFNDQSVHDAGRAIIGKNVDEYLAAAEGFFYPTAVKRLHKLRIAGKHLRYALELFQPVFDEDELVSVISDVKKMQSHLGEVHDCDVWIPEMRRFLPEPSKAAIDTEFHAAGWLISQFTRRRTTAYCKVLDLWMELTQRDLWGELTKALETLEADKDPGAADETRLTDE